MNDAIDDSTFTEQLLSFPPSSFDTLVTVINEKEDDIMVEVTIQEMQQEEYFRYRRMLRLSHQTPQLR